MKKILAVSGGIDSMVMLHLFRGDPDVIVAHFDHGIRAESSRDCDFVKRMAESYELPFFAAHANLGIDCSEERARKERYVFLRKIAQEYGGQIYTAHHQNDVVETIAINCLRGTGWRGLAPFNDKEIQRPLLSWPKSKIYRYATENQIRFRQDSTNTEEKYLRNRVRRALYLNCGDSSKLFDLYEGQEKLRNEIEQIEANIIGGQGRQLRELFIETPDDCAIELLRCFLIGQGIRLTGPQLLQALHAIREYSPGKLFSLNRDFYLKIERYYCSIQPV